MNKDHLNHYECPEGDINSETRLEHKYGKY